MAGNKLALIAHLMRRAGFGAAREELEAYAEKGYEGAVEDLVYPERFPEVEEDVIFRYYSELNGTDPVNVWNGRWLYRMVNTKRPLQEKMALFWHHVFATSVGKSEHAPSSVAQIGMFQRNALANLRTILIDLAKDPAMIHWLDNNENHNGAPNENWARELLELFSMGVGNYTEQDIKNAARAFTGWTFVQPLPLDPYGRYTAKFVYKPEDHDDSEKVFLGRRGRFNGEDMIDIILEQPAAYRFIARHLYNFFVADEPQVPAWPYTPPQDPKAIQILIDALKNSKGNMREVMRVLFNSHFFKKAQFKKVKSPIELVVGVVKLVGSYRFPDPGLLGLDLATTVMGQTLMAPPTVEGWHTGKEWIDAGTLNERINFSVNEVSDLNKPGIKDLVQRLSMGTDSLSPGQFVHGCLDLVGPLSVSNKTRDGLLAYAGKCGELRFGTSEGRAASSRHVTGMLRLIVSSIDFQYN